MGVEPPLTSSTHWPCALQPAGTLVGHALDASHGGEQKSPVRPVTVTFISLGWQPPCGSPYCRGERRCGGKRRARVSSPGGGRGGMRGAPGPGSSVRGGRPGCARRGPPAGRARARDSEAGAGSVEFDEGPQGWT